MFQFAIFVFAFCLAAAAGQSSRDGTCDEGWSQICNGENKCHCYQFVNAYARWDDARQICNGFGGDLPSVHSEAENKFLYVLPNDLARGAWLGLRREDSTFVWSDETPFDYSNWHVDAPSNGANYSNCVQNSNCVHYIGYLDDDYTVPFQWKDTRCDNLRSILCQKPLTANPEPASCPVNYIERCFPIGGCNCYSYQQRNADWTMASAYCRQDGADQVSIHSNDENNFLAGLIKAETWIGFQAGDTLWTDGTDEDYINWGSGVYNSNAAYFTPGSSTWDSSTTTVRKHFICKKPLGF